MPYTTVNKSTDFFSTNLYTGDGSSSRSLTGFGHQPDFIWVKRRDGTNHPMINDSVMGATKWRYSDLSQLDDTSTQAITYGTDGLTWNGGNYDSNTNTYTYALWSMKAGTTSGISAGSQTITPSAYSINATAGFGIYKWSRTGASTTDYFSHGLGATPTIAIQKRTDNAQDWYVNTTIIDGTNDNLHLNKTDAKEDDSTTVPTSTNYYPKSPETGDYITYLFAPIKGFSNFGSYVGNGNADGAFVYTGFKPAFVIIKKYTGTDNWIMFDNKRDPHNVVGNYLFTNTTAANASGTYMDFVSNGFKLRTSDGWVNNGSHSYIYMAFAEAPLVGTNNIPATAR